VSFEGKHRVRRLIGGIGREVAGKEQPVREARSEQQRLKARRPGGRARDAAERGPQQPCGVFATFRVPAEPEQGFGRATRRRPFDRRRDGRLRHALGDRRRIERRRGHRPRVLAAAASLAGDDLPILSGDTAEAPGHQLVVASSVSKQEDAHGDRPAFDRAVLPDRCVRQRQERLEHRRHLQRLTEQSRADRRQEFRERWRFEHAHAERVGDQHTSGTPCLDEAGDAECRIRPQFERVAIVIVHAPPDGVYGAKAGDGFQEDAIVANSEISALHERNAKLAREVHVLEVCLVEPSRCEEHRRRRIVADGRVVEECVLERVAKGGERTNTQPACNLRKQACDDGAVLQRVPEAGGRLHTCATHVPPAVRRTHEVEGHQVQIHASRWRDAVTGA
jgi:hypothetical protein